MKKFFILFLVSSPAFAQFGIFSKDPIINKENFDKQRIHFGYYLGFNALDFKMDYNKLTEGATVDGKTGFNVGIIGNLRITEHLDLRLNPDFILYSVT